MTEKTCSACGQPLPQKPTGERRRKPQSKLRWPPTMSASQIEAAIDKLCGCGGRWDCDCISAFNKACGDAWYDHNTAPA